MEDGSKCKISFWAPQGFFQWRRMPFGVVNAQAVFQRVMELILAGLTWRQCLCYIVVFGRTYDHHLFNLEDVLKALAKQE